MNQDKRIEMLSAYLDGESTEPEAVERLLREDAEAQRLFEVLKAQSEFVRGLPLPEVAPEFAARVLARAREEGVERHRGWMPLVLPFAAAATVVLMLGAVYFATLSSPGPSGHPFEDAVAHWRHADPEALDAALLEGLAEVREEAVLLEYAYGVESVEAFLDPADVLALAQMADVIDNEVELDALLDELTPGEEVVFRELLLEYAMEG